MTRVYRRRLELLDAGVVHHEQWDGMVHFDVRHQSEPAIIEDQPASVETSGNNSVILADGQIAHHDKPYVILGNARRPKRDVFCNCIIFTIAAAGRKCRERCAPAIGYSPLSEVAHRANREVNRAVDHADAGPTGTRTAFSDYGKKLLRGRGTEFRAVEATRQDFTLSADIGFNASPLRQELAVYYRHDVETEWFP
jgi:hypothetical protein